MNLLIHYYKNFFLIIILLITSIATALTTHVLLITLFKSYIGMKLGKCIIAYSNCHLQYI